MVGEKIEIPDLKPYFLIPEGRIIIGCCGKVCHNHGENCSEYKYIAAGSVSAKNLRCGIIDRAGEASGWFVS